MPQRVAHHSRLRKSEPMGGPPRGEAPAAPRPCAQLDYRAQSTASIISKSPAPIAMVPRSVSLLTSLEAGGVPFRIPATPFFTHRSLTLLRPNLRVRFLACLDVSIYIAEPGVWPSSIRVASTSRRLGSIAYHPD